MKSLQLTKQQKKEIIQTFTKYINSTNDTDISFKYCIPFAEKKKATVCFTATAYLKMFGLVQHCDKEVGWYGLVQKVDTATFLITDIIVYPQVVTAATVEQDENKEALWFASLPDETINAIRFQGHSHVNMGVTPSGQDNSNRQEFLTQIKENDFFIFAIANKRSDLNLWVYDRATSVIYEPADVECRVVDEQGCIIREWAEAVIKEQVTPRTFGTAYTTPTTTTSATVQQAIKAVETNNEKTTNYSKEYLQSLYGTKSTDYKPATTSKAVDHLKELQDQRFRAYLASKTDEMELKGDVRC